jgi:fatty acid desaturase
LISHAFIDGLLFLSIGFLVFAGFEWAMSPFVTVLMLRNFGLMHDAVHSAVSDRKWLNHFVGHVSGCLCLLPYETWKKSHLQHHLWSGNIEKDPVMALRVVLPKAPSFLQKGLTFFWRRWVPALAGLQYVLFWKLCFDQAKQSRSPGAFIGFLAPLGFWGALFALSPERFVIFGFLPALTMYLLGAEVVNLPHHLQLPMTKGEERQPVWNQYMSSRTCLYPKWFARLVVLNFNYHSEHHMFPDAPWYRLEQVHDLVQKELGSQQNIDLNLSWILRNRPLHLLKVIEPSEEKKAA